MDGKLPDKECTAMAGLTIKELEDGVLAALTVQLGDDVKSVRSFQGDWLEELRQGGMRLPAVLVMLKGSKAEQVGATSYDLTVEFQVLAMGRGLRGEASRREESGIYDLLAGIREALWHQDLGLMILPLALVKEEPLLNDQEYCVHGAQYRTVLVQDFAG
jgi:phage gp37-like protein